MTLKGRPSGWPFVADEATRRHRTGANAGDELLGVGRLQKVKPRRRGASGAKLAWQSSRGGRAPAKSNTQLEIRLIVPKKNFDRVHQATHGGSHAFRLGTCQRPPLAGRDGLHRVRLDVKRLTVTTLTLRRIKGHFVVTGPDIPPMQFKSRPEAKDWCKAHFPSSPITEIGRDASRRVIASAIGRPRKGG